MAVNFKPMANPRYVRIATPLAVARVRNTVLRIDEEDFHSASLGFAIASSSVRLRCSQNIVEFVRNA
jgi:hypothetical protein